MDDLLTRRVKIGVQYIGTKYCGWQAQKNALSVQELVEKALGDVVRHEVRLVASGRTDEGVHARRQVAHFDTTADIKPFNLVQGANVRLPDDVALLDAEYVDDSFDARKSAKRKTYVYRMYVGSVRQPFLDVNHLQIYKQPDVEAMQTAAAAAVGKHDFSCFCATGRQRKNARQGDFFLRRDSAGEYNRNFSYRQRVFVQHGAYSGGYAFVGGARQDRRLGLAGNNRVERQVAVRKNASVKRSYARKR